MKKDEILYLANGLYNEALLAQTYLSFIKQFNEFKSSDKYNVEISVSPCFYQVSCGAWLRALFMELSKMYDVGKKCNALKTLKEALKDINPEGDFSGRNLEMFLDNNGLIYFPIEPHDLKIVPDQYSSLYDICVDEGIKCVPLQLPYEECVIFFNKKWCSIKKEREKLRRHRNKVFAHNGLEAHFDFERVNQESPLCYSDMECLIDYAMMITRFTIGMLTDIDKPKQYANQNDWEATLLIVREGRICINEQFAKDNYK